MPDSLYYSSEWAVPSYESVVEKIRDCRSFMAVYVREAPLCKTETLDTLEDFFSRYHSCMNCHRATSDVRCLVWHTDTTLKQAFVHIDAVTEACTAVLGAIGGVLPKPSSEVK